MAKLSSVLSNIFGFFNLLFAIVGVVVIILAILIHVNLSNVQEFGKIGGVVILYVIGFITLTISFLGAYGAFRQVKWMLIVFLVLMCVGFLFLVRIAVVLVMMVKSITEEQLHALLPLDKTSMDFRSIMDGFQSSMDCCGLFNGYEDWNENVPESCNCPPPEETMTDVCVVIPGNYLEAFFSQRMVYSQSCGPILLTLLKTAFDGVMGVFFGLTTLTVLGIAISSCLIARINKNRIAGVVLGPTLVFSTSPPKYNELVNEPYH